MVSKRCSCFVLRDDIEQLIQCGGGRWGWGMVRSRIQGRSLCSVRLEGAGGAGISTASMEPKLRAGSIPRGVRAGGDGISEGGAGAGS